jgi:ATP-binding cassette, subfamily B, bacterial PglK
VLNIYRKIFTLLDAKERRQFWMLTGVMTLVAGAEVMGMTAVLVLLNVLAEPGSIQNNAVLGFLYDTLGFESTFSFQVGISILVFLVVMLGIAIKAAGSYATSMYATMRGSAISSRLLEIYLRQPYRWFLERNSAEIGQNVLAEVDGLVGRVITPALRLIANGLLVLSILLFLLFVDPLVTLFTGGVLGVTYALIYLRLHNELRRAGEDMVAALGQRFRIAQESTGGIKDVKILGKEAVYMEVYSKAAHRTARSNAKILLMGEMPRFALEALSFGTILSLILVLLLRSGGDISNIVPVLGVIAYATMRLLPSLQQIYFGLTSIRGATASMAAIVADLALVKTVQPLPGPDVDPLPLLHQLDLAGLSFAYPTASRAAVRELSLTIPARTTVGIVGGTGAGKTTLVDLVLGLLTPDAGEIRVDGKVVSGKSVAAWQKTLGYVPQSIFLTDDSIASNIAFGVPKDAIDMAAVERAARTAALHDFITSELPLGYETPVGERGVRLSGGQRQRIGIARALYREPSMLIMDEATSALDNITERVVMDAVQRIREDKTIILIAHRLSTVKTCDTIFLMEQGRLVAQGTYDELLAGNEVFRRMVSGDAAKDSAA